MYTERFSQPTFLPQFVDKDSVVFDLGFNRGEFSFPIIEFFGARVIAVEPVSGLVDAAPKNNRLELINAAVATSDGVVAMIGSDGMELSSTVLEDGTVSSVLDSDGLNRFEVAGVCLSTLFSKPENELIDLLKIDIEGAELDVLEGADEVLGVVKQITIEFHDFWYPELGPRTERVKQKLQDLGFYMIRFTPNNKDVLFINLNLIDIPLHTRFYLRHIVRNLNGFGRMLQLYSRKLSRQDG